MPSDRSVHDNHVYAFSVECEGRRLVLHTVFRDRDPIEYTDVIFSNVYAHHFENVLPSNILFDVEEGDLEGLVRENAEWFAQSWKYGWPPFDYGGDVARLVNLMQTASARAFEINSSYGMSGWVVAGSVERVARESAWQPE